MTARSLVVWASCLLAVTACATGGGTRPGGRQPADIEMTPTGYCEVLAADGLVDWAGNTATLCPGGFPEGDIDEDPTMGAACTVYSVDGNGALVPAGISGARSAQALGDGRFLVWGWDGRLTLDDGRGGVTEIAPVATDPYLDAASGKVAFVAPLLGATSLDPGDDREVVLYDILSATSVSVVVDLTAAAPLPIPGTGTASSLGDVLYVSTAAGVAQIVRVTPSETVTLTNRDATGVEQEFVPIYGRQVLFTDGGDFLVFTAQYESDVIWRVNLTNGESEELGPGRYPAFGNDGSVLAGSTSGGDGCASHYLDGMTP